MSGGQTARTRRWWTEEEDRILREAVAAQANEDVFNDWNSIATKLPGRSNKDCRKRWSKICTDVKKGAWDIEEDKRLWAAVERHGFCWTEVAQEVQTRHADQCAKRWQHSLDPSVLHGKWEAEDDEKLLRAVQEFGRSWSRISDARFPTRSPTDIKNRHTLILRRLHSEWQKACKHELKVSTEECIETGGFLDEVASTQNEWGNEPLSNMSSEPSREKRTRERDNTSTASYKDWINLTDDYDLPAEQSNMLGAQDLSLAWNSMSLPTGVTPSIPIAPAATASPTDPFTNTGPFLNFPSGPSRTKPEGTSAVYDLPSTFNPISSSSSTITLVIHNLKPHTMGVILDTLYRDGAEYKLAVHR